MDRAGNKTPQVLYIVYDDLRPDLSLYNLSFMHTPNLQKLADSGTVFDRACELIALLDSAAHRSAAL